MNSNLHVVILGGGFAGLQAAKSLRRADVDITLIDRRNFHLFQPLLYQVATGELSPANISAPLRALLRKQQNARVLLGEVQDIDLERQVVRLTDRELAYDFLVVALGSVHHYFGHDDWEKIAPGLKTIENATEIRRQLLGAFEAAERSLDPEEIRDLLTFAIVGAGPTGCELAGTIAEIARHTLKNDFRNINPADARIVLIEPSEYPLDVYSQPLPSKAAKALQRLGVELVTCTRVTDIHQTHVELLTVGNEQPWRINTRTVLWAAGVKASPIASSLLRQTGMASARGGRIPVQSDTSLKSHPNVFVVGDLASFNHDEKGDLPGLAPVATQMGAHAAKCIVADLNDKSRTGFRYRDRGSMAVIGRYSAVGVIGGWKFHGFVAWFLWLAVHLMYITMFRNRILVLVQWGWTFLTHDRSARLILDGPTTSIPQLAEATGWDNDSAMPHVESTAQETES
ncbi:NAD(P)/FAD-dependent oxidoreductase [Novipirellula artificiosorum]|uniref:NADH:ubiquinone reductase (non-electrogenic) n=1 Tax=Novipirellula artificiosorum TaxID=2528016 RepID=A0A5C6DQ67_9BACT|nr:NAD(P)/FAD-dependent oxidoreductase [Novipirellula artificiosorum]TWU39423.1 NADH dehydrogenase-like protein [Novipirellula artificiosorum]